MVEPPSDNDPGPTCAVRLAAEACDIDRLLLQVLRSGMALALPPTCEVCWQAPAEWFAPTLGPAGRLLCPGCVLSTESVGRPARHGNEVA